MIVSIIAVIVRHSTTTKGMVIDGGGVTSDYSLSLLGGGGMMNDMMSPSIYFAVFREGFARAVIRDWWILQHCKKCLQRSVWIRSYQLSE